MSNPIDHARAALAGDIEVPVMTVICDVCSREIPQHTARVIPAIGFMCPEGVEPKCEPQRSIWDEIKESNEKDRDRRIDAIQDLILNWDPDYETSSDIALKAYEIALDPTRYIERN